MRPENVCYGVFYASRDGDTWQVGIDGDDFVEFVGVDCNEMTLICKALDMAYSIGRKSGMCSVLGSIHKLLKAE